jgi:hypothetical protein
MKSTIATALLGGLTLAISLTPLASAQAVGAEAKINVEAKVHASSTVKASANATSSVKKDDDRGSATSSARREDRAEDRDDDHGNATSTAAEATGQVNAEAHRSAVATFVKSLLEVADREGGIGKEVREVAQSQQASASTTVAAITKVESKGKWSTFFFGSDYTSLGELRNELVTTQNNIDKLKKLVDKSWYLFDKTELEAQIKTLEDSKVEITAFIDAHEDTFSLLGWAAKWFSN